MLSTFFIALHLAHIHNLVMHITGLPYFAMHIREYKTMGLYRDESVLQNYIQLSGICNYPVFN